MQVSGSLWRLLIVSLPTPSATARMRIWRGIKSLGCMPLRDGAYLLPSNADREEALQQLAHESIREGGSAWLMTIQSSGESEDRAYRQLFDRADDYAELHKTWKATNRTLASLEPSELTRLRKRLQREYDAVRAIDFFPNETSAEAEAEWLDLHQRIEGLLSPDEPHDVQRRIPRLDREQYRGRVWATRRRLWVDRVASAWLIRRFIDPEAQFRWLASPSDCPKKALGFDFDGATFTHVGDRVTFEMLMASFGLEGDPALARLAAIVHQLDVGGEPVPEAVGFEAVMAGARERLAEDDALLAEMSAVLDSLYAHFGRASAGAKS
jgi:hypothetical protein